MIESVTVIGARGRVGAAVAARLAKRGVELRPQDAPDVGVVLLCVPDRAIGEVAAITPEGPWIGHVSGATPLSALAPHRRRFSLHPLQTFTHERGPEQLDGAFAAVAADDPAGLAVATDLAALLGLTPFPLADEARGAYHAAAVMASNYVVTLRRAAGLLMERAGAPAEALDPLVRRVQENRFALTGPIDRGDWETVERNRAAIHERAPELEEAYTVLADLTAHLAGVERKQPA
jgi:predicted short-subunit dehydrogenase-like oxidoreductase (DUF2520 family)